MMSPAVRWAGLLERCASQKNFCYVLGIPRLAGGQAGEGRGGTTVLGIYDPSREFQAPMQWQCAGDPTPIILVPTPLQ